jgi:hypothetical protein
MHMYESPEVYLKDFKTLIVNYKSDKDSLNFYIATLYESEEFCKESFYISTLYDVKSERNLIRDF